MLERIAKISPLFGSLLIFLGLLKLSIYYSEFHINIIEFLSFSEIITSFLNDMNILILFTGIMVITTLATEHYFNKISPNLIDKVFEVLFAIKNRVAFFFGIPVILFGTLLLTDLISPNYFIIYITTFSLLQCLTYAILKKNEEGEIEISNAGGLIIGLISLSFAVFLLAFHDLHSLRKRSQNISIYGNNFSIQCNSNTKNVFLGKTSQFVFIKKDSSKSTIIIATKDIQRFEFGSPN